MKDKLEKIPLLYYNLLKLIAEKGKLRLEDGVALLKEDQANIVAGSFFLKERGWIQIEEKEYREYRVGAKGKEYNLRELPERIVLKSVLERGVKELEISSLSNLTGLESKWAGESIKWLIERGWFKRDKGRLVITDFAIKAKDKKEPDELLWEILFDSNRWVKGEELKEKVPSFEEALSVFMDKRKRFIEERVRKERIFYLTELGEKVLKEEKIAPIETVTLLTTELLKDGKWRGVEFRSYDITLKAQDIFPGKIHPVREVYQRTREIFLRMGFREVSSPYVELAFWDFDALFQPQDHPARDMQDTFYLKQPPFGKLPPHELVEKVRMTHENGWETGSKGWRYKWKEELAVKVVLRTHTTAATIRALASHPSPPYKVFCIGPVFRRETLTYKHLPVFHQVDGIIIDKEANFRVLLGILKEFYTKLGFEKIQFRPAFFPYTEPSVEIFIWHEKKRDWVEMGGSGIFRPEVTRPFGCDLPVLAWGLGLERLAMFIYGVERISELYYSDIRWLKERKVCL